LFILSC